MKIYYCALYLRDRSRHLPPFFVASTTVQGAHEQALNRIRADVGGHVVEVDEEWLPVAWPGDDDTTSIIF